MKSLVEQEVWRPNPGPQEESLRRIEFEILYGGARGGGKTDAGLVWLTELVEHPRYRALVIRKNADDLSDWVDRAQRMYLSLGAEVAYRPAEIKFPSGAIIKTGHLKDDQAYTKYQGHEYQRMLIEELTQIPTEKRYLQLISSCRSTVLELKPQIFATTNPGGVGHQWVKSRFVDPAKAGVAFKDKDTGKDRIFIPAKIDDNPVLTKADPTYVDFLEGLKKTDKNLWKTWRQGRWDVFVGQFFNEWNPEIHVVSDFDWNLDVCDKIITYDWGYNDPGCALWLAFTPENRHGIRRAYVYRELYMTGKTPEEWAKDIRTLTRIEEIDYMVLPHDCFSKLGGRQSIADTFREMIKELPFKHGRTLDKNARINRAAITHQYLSLAKDGRPYMLIHENCQNLVRSLPTLIHSETNPEDVDTTGDDHAYDALSMGLISKGLFAKDSAVFRTKPKSASLPTWKQQSDGRIETGDFWKGMKEVQNKGTRGSPEY